MLYCVEFAIFIHRCADFRYQTLYICQATVHETSTLVTKVLKYTAVSSDILKNYYYYFKATFNNVCSVCVARQHMREQILPKSHSNTFVQ